MNHPEQVYYLPVTTMTENNSNKIMLTLIKVSYVKIDVLYTNTAIYGFEFKNINLLQGVSHISKIVENL